LAACTASIASARMALAIKTVSGGVCDGMLEERGRAGGSERKQCPSLSARPGDPRAETP
jgi:hypothetical protein